MGDVVAFTGVTSLDVSPDVVFEAAMKAGLTSVVIVGYAADGSEYCASSVADGGSVLWLLERTKLRLLRVVDDE